MRDRQRETERERERERERESGGEDNSPDFAQEHSINGRVVRTVHMIAVRFPFYHPTLQQRTIL